MFEIIQILRRAEAPVTAQRIADTLEVTKRTVYRDIAALLTMRLPIQGEAGIGYVMRAGYDLPPLMFSAEEMEAIVVGLALLERTGDRDLVRAADRAAAKIADVLPETGPDAPVPASHLRVSTWTGVPAASVQPGTLRRHIREHAEIRLTYIDPQGQRSVRAVKPLALIYYVDAVVLAAWCGLRGDFRHFRVDRIAGCAPTGESFEADAEALRAGWDRQTRVD